MKEYLLSTPIWHNRSEKIATLNGKFVLVELDGTTIKAEFRVDEAPQSSPEHGKVAVAVWTLAGDDEPWQPVTMTPPFLPQTFQELGQWQRFLNSDAVDLICPNARENTYPADFLLTLPQ
jgi:hypothetical protein